MRKKKRKNLSSASRAFSVVVVVVASSSLPRRKIMKILTHARTTTHYPDVSQGPGTYTRYVVVVVVVVDKRFGEKERERERERERARSLRPAFNARFFGRLLSKQTFRRCVRGMFRASPFTTACKHVSALYAPA